MEEDFFDLFDHNDEMKGKYLTFYTDEQMFGVPISDVVQIVGLQTIIQIPEYPDYARGIINLRGAIIPVVDIRVRLHKANTTYNERTCIIVTKIKEDLIGFIVDSVNEVTSIGEELISSPPHMTGDELNKYLTGIGRLEDCVVLLIDPAKLLDENECQQLVEAAQ